MRSLSSNTLQSTLIGIQKNIASIRSITSTSLVGQKKVEIVRRRDIEKDKRKKKEDKIEAFKSSLGKKINSATQKASSGFGLIDYIKNFATFVFWGFIFNKLIPHLPKIKSLLPLLKGLQAGFEWTIDLIGNGLVNFIDFAYEKKDSLSDVAKKIGGENFQKTFDDFSKNFTSFLNIAVVGGLLAFGSGILPKKTPAKPKQPITRTTRSGSNKITTSGGEKVGDVARTTGGRPKVTTSGGRPTSKIGRMTRTVGKFAGSKGIPIIGPLINFGLRALAGDDLGKAAAGSVGMGIGQYIGGFIGSLGAGALGLGTGGLALVVAPLIIGASSVIGGLIGEWIGDSLYDYVSNNLKPQPKIEKKAGGGRITHNGRRVGGPIRRGTRTRKRLPRRSRALPSLPGRDVGGIKKIEKIFPNSTDTKTINPLGTLKHTAATYKTIPIVGKLMGSAIEGSFGQRMNRQVIGEFSDTIGSMVQNIVDGNKITRAEVMAMANGGLVPERTAGLNVSPVGEQISELLKQNLDLMVNNRLTQVFNNLNKEFGKQSYLGSSTSIDENNLPEGEYLSDGLSVTSDSRDFWLLSVASLLEAAPNSDQGAADVAQAIYNRVAMPGDPWKVNDSIRTAILNPGQFQPVRDYGNQSEWDKIIDKQSAVTFIKKYGKGRSQEQLEKVAAALLNPIRQNSARTFVGPRDSFRSYSYENAHNHLANDTEVRREGHAFGFEPRGATIASFRAGKLKPAEINKQVNGSITSTGNSTASFGNYLVNTDGSRINNYSDIKSHHDYQTSKSYRGNKVVDFTIIGKNEKYHNLPIVSPVNGTVISSGNENDGYGNKVIIKTDNGKTVLMAHFSSVKVKTGAKVKAFSTIIALQGTTGRSSGVHIHMDAPEEVIRIYVNTIASRTNKKPELTNKVRVGESKVSSDIKTYRQFRTQFGAPTNRFPTATPRNYQIREMGVYGSGNYKINPLADDTNYEIHEHAGSGHWENRAFDIPVSGLESGDKVANFWRSRGYTVLWRVKDHFNHVHVEVPENKVKEFFAINKNLRASVAKPNNSIASIKPNSTPPAQIANISNKINSQAIASNYTIPTVERTVIVNRKEIQQVIATPPAVVVPGLFPGESSRVNNEAYSVLNT